MQTSSESRFWLGRQLQTQASKTWAVSCGAIVFVLLVAMAIVGGSAGEQAEPNYAGQFDGGVIELTNVKSGFDLHVSNASSRSGDPVMEVQSADDALEGSKWYVVSAAGVNGIMLRSQQSGFYLHVDMDRESIGDPVVHRKVKDEGGAWKFESVDGSETRMRLRSIESNLYLSDRKDSGTHAVVQEMFTDEGSQWDVVLVASTPTNESSSNIALIAGAVGLVIAFSVKFVHGLRQPLSQARGEYCEVACDENCSFLMTDCASYCDVLEGMPLMAGVAMHACLDQPTREASARAPQSTDLQQKLKSRVQTE